MIFQYKMNEIFDKVLLAEDKFMPENTFKTTRNYFSACGSFLKTKKEFENLKKQEIQDI